VNFLVFSFIPYKTPWNIFTAWLGFIFLAGFGAAVLYEKIISIKLRILFNLFIAAILVHLSFQTYLTSFEYADQAENPFTYSQPTKEIFELTKLTDKIIDYNAGTLISVVVKDNEYWPLPWYVRNAINTSWSSNPPKDIYDFDLIIADTAQLDEISRILYSSREPGERDLYIPLLDKEIQLRPGQFISAYIKYDFYNRFMINANE
jgi:hypothetical protein